MSTTEAPAAALTSVETLRTFALAGKARFTLRSKRTGVRFTFKVTQKGEGAPHFVSLLTGSNNEADYAFLGTVFEGKTFKLSPKSRIGAGAPSAKAFAWLWLGLGQGVLSEQVEVWHEGRCGRCNRLLTTPESVERGLGPECVKHAH